MNRVGVFYSRKEVKIEDLPAVRKSVDDFPEGAITLELPEFDKIIVTGYYPEKDITRLAVGRECPGGYRLGGSVMQVNLKGEQLEEVDYKKHGIGDDYPNLLVRVNSHGYAFDKGVDLKDADLSPL